MGVRPSLLGHDWLQLAALRVVSKGESLLKLERRARCCLRTRFEFREAVALGLSIGELLRLLRFRRCRP